MLYHWLRNALDLLFPPFCPLCGGASAASGVCAPCAADLPWNRMPCRLCAAPLVLAGRTCGHCQSRPPAYDQALAAFAYGPPLDHLVKRLKFGGELHVAPALAELMARYLRTRLPGNPRALVPVPLHANRLRERGFNQAGELARALGRLLGVPVTGSLALRLRATAPQSDLPLSRRRHNLRGAFSVRNGPVPEHVAIVDDVMTTGSTVSVLARALKRAGARRVDVWCLCRTPRHGPAAAGPGRR